MSKDSIIKAFEGLNVRIVWDAETEEYYFSVNDIVQVLTESTDPKDYIKKMLKRDPELKSRWGTICPPTRMRAVDGKFYRTRAATLQGILRIVQSIPSRKAEPLKQWLAEVGSQRIDQMIEKELGHSVISPAKAADYLPPAEDVDLFKDNPNYEFIRVTSHSLLPGICL